MSAKCDQIGFATLKVRLERNLGQLPSRLTVHYLEKGIHRNLQSATIASFRRSADLTACKEKYWRRPTSREAGTGLAHQRRTLLRSNQRPAIDSGVLTYSSC